MSSGRLLELMAYLARSDARALQESPSFFAFAATPKHQTLADFGRDGEPVHRYIMRQAIEEELILDVRGHCTACGSHHRLLKNCEGDTNTERRRATPALAHFLRPHPHNFAQETEVMFEHFHAVTSRKVGGRAKAMVVHELSPRSRAP